MADSRRGGRGARVAGLYRQARSLGAVRGCPLDKLLETDGVELAESELGDPGYLGALLRPPVVPMPGVILAPGQTPGQKRFSIAHELGHLHIPTHAAVVGTCGSEEMSSAAASQIELEANEFAAELLMPKDLFRADVGEPPVGFDTLYRLTGPYGVSATAAARRLVEVTTEACAAVQVERGRIRWVHRSRAWCRRSLSLPIWIGDPVSESSLAGAVVRGEDVGDELLEVDPSCWLARTNSHQVLESAHPIPEHEAVVTLIWAIED